MTFLTSSILILLVGGWTFDSMNVVNAFTPSLLSSPPSTSSSSLSSLLSPVMIKQRHHHHQPLSSSSSRSKPTTTSTSALDMFTGIVEEMGMVVSLKEKNDMTLYDGSIGSGTELTVQGKTVMEGAYLGCSISVSGVCLTATALDHDTSTFKVGLAPETLRKTYFATLQPGQMVNLERASEIGGRNSGHFVQGHVDGTGTIVNKWQDGDSLCFEIRLDNPDLIRYVVPKGFIAIDGTSLTVVNVDPTKHTFTFMLVGYTQKKIVIPSKHIGEKVNIEVDVLGKYSETALAAVMPRLEALEAKVESLQRALASATTTSSSSVAPATVVPQQQQVPVTATTTTWASSQTSSTPPPPAPTTGSFAVRNAGFVAGGTASPKRSTLESSGTRTTADDVLQPGRAPAYASTVSATNAMPRSKEVFETLEGRFNRDVMAINYTPPVTAPSSISPMMRPRTTTRTSTRQSSSSMMTPRVGSTTDDGPMNDIDSPSQVDTTTPRSSSGDDDATATNDPPPQAQAAAARRQRSVILGPDTGLAGTGKEFRSILSDKGMDGKQGLPDPLL